MTQPQDEKAFLDALVDTYVTSESPQDRVIKGLAVRAFAPFLGGRSSALELGCSDGYMTSLLAPRFDEFVVVDGSRHFLEVARARNPDGVEFVHSLFEEYSPDRRFDCVFACYILEHVQDPVALIARIGGLLEDDGVLCLVVPNARALSRQLACRMGLLEDPYALTPNDIRHGHRRVYDRRLIDRDIAAAGLVQVAQGGLMMKPFADFQMDAMFEHGILGDAQVDGLYALGLEYPELAGSLFSVCRKPGD